MRACTASTAVKTTTGVRKTLSREFSDSEVHQRVRRKACSLSREKSAGTGAAVASSKKRLGPKTTQRIHEMQKKLSATTH